MTLTYSIAAQPYLWRTPRGARIPMGTRSVHDLRWAQVPPAAMVAAGSVKRHSHRTRIQIRLCGLHSDIIASLATAAV